MSGICSRHFEYDKTCHICRATIDKLYIEMSRGPLTASVTLMDESNALEALHCLRRLLDEGEEGKFTFNNHLFMIEVKRHE